MTRNDWRDFERHTEQEALAVVAERDRVKEMLRRTIATMSETGGNSTYFAAYLLRAALELNVELHGPENLERALASMSKDLLIGRGRAGKA